MQLDFQTLLTTYPEWRKLRRENAMTLSDWIFEEIICRWGSLYGVITNNGTAFVAAMEYLVKWYHINHIRISGYNSCANRRRSEQMVRGSTLCLLGRTRHCSQTHGLFALLRGNQFASPHSPQHLRSNILATPSRFHLIDNRPHHLTSYRPTEMICRPRKTLFESLYCLTQCRKTLRTHSQMYDARLQLRKRRPSPTSQHTDREITQSQDATSISWPPHRHRTKLWWSLHHL
jgi:hypothetical protein